MCGSFSVGTDRYLDMLRSSNHSASAATAGTTPVTTGLFVLISGAAHGNNVPSTVQAIDSCVWGNDTKLARVIRKTLSKARDKVEVHRLTAADDPRDVSASMNRELKGQ